MVILTILHDLRSELAGHNLSRSVDLLDISLEKAVQLGQRSGRYYEIFDLASGRTVDWTEVNYKEENDDAWYYDEVEMLWKKQSVETHPEEVKPRNKMAFH
jgi:hypothetical protein